MELSVALSLRVLAVGGSRLQGAKGDGRLKTTASAVGHRLHAWEENGKREGVAQVMYLGDHWAGNTRTQPRPRFPVIYELTSTN